MEEVSNYLNFRIATMQCQKCHKIFWIDKIMPYNKIGYKCPYCLLTFGTDYLIYSLYYHPDKAVISAKLPDHIPQDFQVVTSPEKVTIRIIDGPHHIEVALETYTKPRIVKQTYSGDTLKIIVKKDFEKPKYLKIPDYKVTRSLN